MDKGQAITICSSQSYSCVVIEREGDMQALKLKGWTGFDRVFGDELDTLSDARNYMHYASLWLWLPGSKHYLTAFYL